MAGPMNPIGTLRDTYIRGESYNIYEAGVMYAYEAGVMYAYAYAYAYVYVDMSICV